MSPVGALDQTTFRRRRRVPVDWRVVVVAAVALVLLAAIVPLLRTGHFVDRVRVQNASAFDIEVDVANSPNDGWMGLTTAGHNRTTEIEQVYDIGSPWYFRFSTPMASTVVRVPRSELARNHWTTSVPASFIAQLRAQGTPPSPQGTTG